jgi:hypothetical protein
MTLRTAGRVTLPLGVVSAVAVLLANLALLDIYHGESDLTLEWNVLRLAFIVIAAFHVLALVVARKASELPRD